LTDEALIREARKGDDQAFKEIVRRYEPKVAATVIGMMGGGPEAEDVGQEVFVRFYTRLDHFQGASALGTYLTRIAINLSLNALKKRKRRRSLFWEKSVEAYAVPSDNSVLPYDEKRAIVRQMLQRLSPEFRSVIVLRIMEGYSTRETAEILNIREGTVLSRLARGQRKMKTWLMPYYGDEYGCKRSRPVASVV